MKQLLLLGWKTFYGYRKNKIPTILFISIILSIILFSVDCLISSFDNWITRSQQFSLPQFSLNNYKSYDIKKYSSIHDLCIDQSSINKIKKQLKNRYNFYDGYVFSTYLTKDNNENLNNVLIVIINFSDLPKVFPFFQNLNVEEMISAKKTGIKIIANKEFSSIFSAEKGDNFLLFFDDFFHTTNLLKLELNKIVDSPLSEDDIMSAPTIFIDLAQIKYLYNIPSSLSMPCFVVPKKIINSTVFSIKYFQIYFELKKAASLNDVSFYSSMEINKEMKSTYILYKKICFYSFFLILLIVTYAISTNLYVHFHTRLKEIGIYKAYGIEKRGLYFFLFFENFYGLCFSLVIAFVFNLLLSLIIPSFGFLGNSIVTTKITYQGFLCIFIIYIVLSFVSVLKVFFYVKKLNPATIFIRG
mgnify:CR=1 FL=1